MNFFETKNRRKFLFASLYLSEGAPIGFIWLALPTRLRASSVPVEQITWLAAILVLPWTFKFAWAPLIDILRTSRWTLRHWIISAQCLMGLTLLPLHWIDPKSQFTLLTITLFAHALSAATQDVAIDALCISATAPGERGQYNGWMQAGMLLGRAFMGGGALVLTRYIGNQAVVGLLIMLTTFSTLLLMMSPPPESIETRGQKHWENLRSSIRLALSDRNLWIGLLFALIGGAGFKSLEVIYGPFLIDRGFDEQTIGWFSMGPMIGLMIAGSVLGGWVTDKIGPHRCVAFALAFISLAMMAIVINDNGPKQEPMLLVGLATTAFGIGLFTASSYALFMDITRPAIAATQFSTFMGATNGCESWSSYTSGLIIGQYGYPRAMLTMSTVSLLAIPLLALLRSTHKRDNKEAETQQ